MNKGGLIVAKKEMTKIWVGDAFVPVTLVKVLPQEIIRYKDTEKDGYIAAVIGVDKKKPKKMPKGTEVQKYTMVAEMKVDEEFIKSHEVGKVLDVTFLEGVEKVAISGMSKGKGFQGVIKKFHFKGMGATHGHKYRRLGGSKGNRKPRRGFKGHPHAGHMGHELTTLKNIAILDTVVRDDEQLLVLKGSLPGPYNGVLKLFVS